MNTNPMPRLPMTGSRPFPPAQSAFTQRFWQALDQGQFLATHCPHCERLAFPPKPFCPHCWQRGVEWRAIAPRGVLYSATTIYAAPKVFGAEAPYQVAIVDLHAGLRIATRLVGDTPTAQALDREVELVVLAYEDGPLFAARLSDSP
ncbi:Zn-ribbon domain-containing OB-fold protein [Hydrogenophaga borbori]|uniref:Zn-ribbon domain-containing OB-fold protein n=1 Tax=Hydrogenophaga borbori TaxID=2294117 RepID=A0A372EHM0_9BURK|nr:Zn-ribbon domain-containing OB-fold protein [Hydrogenophaga borbori]RFP77952.1 Zn-ribbon domain-containing OB-fold protein [Hydrogenophaga borbori]